jgi:hypothetical protein
MLSLLCNGKVVRHGYKVVSVTRFDPKRGFTREIQTNHQTDLERSDCCETTSPKQCYFYSV